MFNRTLSRRIAALSLGALTIGVSAGVAMAADGPTALYFALGLPAAGTFIAWVLRAGWGPSDI